MVSQTKELTKDRETTYSSWKGVMVLWWSWKRWEKCLLAILIIGLIPT